MGVLHADAPALHGRNAIEKSGVGAILRCLDADNTRVSTCPEVCGPDGGPRVACKVANKGWTGVVCGREARPVWW